MLSKLTLISSVQFLLAFSKSFSGSSTAFSSDHNRVYSRPYDWTGSYTSDFTLHYSCNTTQKHELLRGLSDAVTLARHAREHILIHGADSPIYKKYFGQGPTGSVLGWYDKIENSNRKGIVFRCDDPDMNCETQNQWAGHYRGKNASLETVICELSFLTRLPLEALCARGFDIATGQTNRYWGLDLIHRLYHVEKIGEGAIKHETHSYQEALDLAASENFRSAATNTESLLLFASEAYAFDITNPGVGCPGTVTKGSQVNSHKVTIPTVSYTKANTVKSNRFIPHRDNLEK